MSLFGDATSGSPSHLPWSGSCSEPCLAVSGTGNATSSSQACGSSGAYSPPVTLSVMCIAVSGAGEASQTGTCWADVERRGCGAVAPAATLREQL